MNEYTKKQIESAMRNGRKVTIVTPSRDYRRSNNGGEYEYTEEYKYRGGIVTVRYTTSAEFAYCQNCGAFTAHNEWDNCQPRTMALSEAVETIMRAQGNSKRQNSDGEEICDYVIIKGM